MRLLHYPLLILIAFALHQPLLAQGSDAPEPPSASIQGTVTDIDDSVVPNATVVLQGADSNDRRTTTADANGDFQFHDVKAGVPYHITVSAKGFAVWVSPVVILQPGQYKILTGSRLGIAEAYTTITVSPRSEEVATEQVKQEEQQRVLGIVPNFYTVFDPNPAPLTAKLKFHLAFKLATDPVTAVGVAMLAGIDQAADTPNYVQGAKGFGQRLGANAADGFTDILIGGAILPSLLHQDPRYFYQGTGTKTSRTLHALEHPFVTMGDNGKWQPNYSSMGGDLATAAISNLYYPDSNRGVGHTFQNFAVTTAERMATGLVQEFVLRKLTPKAKKQQ